MSDERCRYGEVKHKLKFGERTWYNAGKGTKRPQLEVRESELAKPPI